MFWQDETDRQDTPEARLWKAVINRAIHDCFHANYNNMSHAWHWIYSSNDSSFNSFGNLCTMADCNQLLIRQLIAQEFMSRYKQNPDDKINNRIYENHKGVIEKYANV